MHQLRKATPARLFFVYTVICTASNFVHPVTPTLFQMLDFPSYMFGAAFSAMSLANFLFSPYWGYLSDRHGRRLTMILGMAIYTAGQLAFAMATTVTGVLLARVLAGVGSAAYMAVSLAYLVDITTPEHTGKYLAYFMAFQSLSGSAGYLIGGVLGDRSILLSFGAQVVMLGVGTLLAWLLIGESRTPQDMALSRADTGAKKFYDFQAMGRIMTLPVALFLLSTCLATFGTQGYDNSFNYYIRDVFSFPPSYNGYIKASTGLVALAANFTLNLWILRRFSPRRALLFLLPLCGVTLLIVPAMKTTASFLAACMGFYVFNAIYLPVQQAMMAQIKTENTGLLSGMFTAAKSAGNFAGPLAVGFLYGLGSKLPFYLAAAAFLLSAATLSACRLSPKTPIQIKEESPC